MRERRARLLTIQRLIKDNRVRSQDVLLEMLQQEGYSITQATLSRDLKFLKVGKISDGGEGYYYTTPEDGANGESEYNYLQDLIRGWVSVEFSANIGIVKTLTGHADSVAIALDNLDLDEVLGTVAGDDTIVLVLREGVEHSDFLRELAEQVPEIGATLR